MERIILEENKNKQDSEINKVHKFLSAVNKELLVFNSDTGGYQLRLDQVIKVLNGADTYYLLEPVDAFFDKQLDNSKITGKLMRDNFKAGTKELINKFLFNMKSLNNMQGSEYIHNGLSMNNAGLLELTKENEDKIKDSFRSCINTDDGNEFYKKHEEAAKHLSSFCTFVKKHTEGLNYINISQLAGNFFSLDNTSGEVKVNHVNYDRFITKKAV
ncbi:MAG TPA: hypothetical protein VGP43_02495 [Chitinophagaceae bacterium]|nr:hypothetical protein [Chitinophagaceae bacterium]